MPLIFPDDDDQHAAPDGLPFRLLVLVPEFIDRLVDKLVSFLIRRRVG